MAQGLFFKVGAGAGRRPTRAGVPKNATAPSAFSLLGAPQAPGDKPNLPKGVKAWEEGPWGRRKKPQAPRHTRPDPCPDSTAGQSATQHLERSRPRAICHQTDLSRGICRPPHLTGKYGTRPFFRWDRAQGHSHTRRSSQKMPTAPSAFPLLGAPQAPGDKPNLPEGSKSLGGRPPWGRRKYSPGTETHSARSVPRQHGRPKCYPAPGEVQTKSNLSPDWSQSDWSGIRDTAIYGRCPSSLCWKGRRYPTV